VGRRPLQRRCNPLLRQQPLMAAKGSSLTQISMSCKSCERRITVERNLTVEANDGKKEKGKLADLCLLVH
jgi:hypothetical protein